ncbi:hypothetical protein [Clostridium beijerinckii]|uniref:hypothetical protein n=1 Tax=Clostridium beijerinckii TaxID=1520 RepID=UPI001361189A|nr:hypothetical protein [Clostridium beijerinckii]MZK53626.1 hypothetical protein [Clostridium beijerinckii]MZK61737.1 hypothetical protein [Clostridium beijerinckii]MZK71936.1 hypothetical protein [Clostridium beijerinckii]MZK77323.1 hypothetical protein [Clostridium beijerinckii]MZK86907.1 hypothetical protein [Clostridium beijerinckii]
MYKIKYCHSDLELEEFIKEVNQNNYEIISNTEFKGKLTIIYKVEEKKKSSKRTKQVKADEDEGKENKDTMKEGE